MRAFAKRLGVTSSYVSKVLNGTRAVPYAKISKWALAMKLSASEQEEFRELALLALCPNEISDLVDELRQQVRRLEAKR